MKVGFQACPKNLPPKDRRPKPIRTKSALHLEHISLVPKSEPPSTKCRVAPTGRALSLSRVPHEQEATNLDVLDVTARGVLVWQGDVKQGGADLLVAPPKLNVRLPCQGPSQRQEVRRSVERRNLVVQHAVEASRVAIPIVGRHQDLLRNTPALAQHVAELHARNHG